MLHIFTLIFGVWFGIYADRKGWAQPVINVLTGKTIQGK